MKQNFGVKKWENDFILGRPNEPVLTSLGDGLYSDQFNLTWSVESHADITSYRLIYRKWMVSK